MLRQQKVQQCTCATQEHVHLVQKERWLRFTTAALRPGCVHGTSVRMQTWRLSESGKQVIKEDRAERSWPLALSSDGTHSVWPDVPPQAEPKRQQKEDKENPAVASDGEEGV